MSLYREVETYLAEWKNKIKRKPLVLRGARQVGKTTLVKKVAKTYTYHILLNLEKKEDIHFFNEYNSTTEIIEALFITKNIPLSKMSDCLLFIDEIQESPKAIHLLRYFYEDNPAIHVIAAGSLLEFVMKDVKSFPVGRVEFLYLSPINFHEYLQAINHEMALEYFNQIPFKKIALNTLYDLFHQYIIVGGMPEAVDYFVETKSYTELGKIYNSIWETYKNDIHKYTSNKTERNVIKHIISTAHLYIDQRIKFQNFGNSNYRSREVGEAFRSLDDAKVIQLIYPTTDVEIPIRPNIRKSPRLQFLDTGVVNRALGIQAKMLAMDDMSTLYKGAIIPHMITQELISINVHQQKKPNFWVREKSQASSEVDLVYEYDEKIIPIEIKSGKVGKLRSLHQFMERCPHEYAVRIYGGNFVVEQWETPSGKPFLLMNLPYFLGTKIPEYISYFVQEHKL